MGGSLNRDELMSVATTQTGLDDFGDIPFHEPLDVLIESLNREAGLAGTVSAPQRQRWLDCWRSGCGSCMIASFIQRSRPR